MKKTADLVLVTLIGALLALGACSNDASEDLPTAVNRFITQYFPGLAVKTYTELPGGGSSVTLGSGPTVTFDSDNQWTAIDGNGHTLPQVLMYDQLPPGLYAFLQATSQEAQVYAVKRDARYYKLTMLDTVLTYDISTGQLSYPGQEPEIHSR